MTFDQYFKQVNGKGIDFDGRYGVQCFDLANDYCVKVLGGKQFVGMYAWEIYQNFANQPSKSLFDRIPNTPDFVPKKGDIIVWAQSLNGKAGHVAVCTGEGDKTWFNSYDQNWTGRNDPCTKIKHDYSHVLGVLRPKTQSSIKFQKKTVSAIAQEVLDGKWGNGDTRRQKLTAAGYSYNEVQTKVNELIKEQTMTRIAQEILAGKWGNGVERARRLAAAGYNYTAIQRKVNELLKR